LKAGENCKSKPSTACIVMFTRGLRRHRYFRVALWGFFFRKKDVLVVFVGGLARKSTLRKPSYHWFPSGKTTSCRLVVTLVFRYRNFIGTKTNRKRRVDQEVNLPEKNRRRWVDQEVNPPFINPLNLFLGLSTFSFFSFLF